MFEPLQYAFHWPNTNVSSHTSPTTKLEGITAGDTLQFSAMESGPGRESQDVRRERTRLHAGRSYYSEGLVRSPTEVGSPRGEWVDERLTVLSELLPVWLFHRAPNVSRRRLARPAVLVVGGYRTRAGKGIRGLEGRRRIRGGGRVQE